MNAPDIVQIIGVGTTAAAALLVVVAISVRVVFAPVLKAKRIAAEAQAQAQPDTARLDARMDALEEEVRQIGQTLGRVADAVEFDAQLRGGGGASQPPRLPEA